MLKISACVITKNEEKNIARSINSYKDIANEIIVVDSESTDRTAQIAESLGATVYIRPWTNDFAAAKNFAIERATGDWIIFLDADEFFETGHGRVALQYIQNAEEEGAGVITSPRHEIIQAGGSVYAITHVERIFKNTPETRYANKIHECLQRNGKPISSVDAEEVVIFHTGYDPQLMKEKIRRNLALLQDPDLVMINGHMKCFYLAECYSHLGMHEEAITECRNMMKHPEFEIRLYHSQKIFRIYIFYVEAMLAQRESYSEKEIEAVVDDAVENFGKHPEIRHMQFAFFNAYGRIDDAIGAMEEAFRMDASYHHPYANCFNNVSGRKYIELALLYKLKNDVEKAGMYWLKAIQIDKEDQTLRFELFMTMRTLMTEEKKEIIEGLFDIHTQEELKKVIGTALQTGCNDIFAEYFLKMAKTWPEALQSDKSLLGKVFLLQNNYAGILELAEAEPENEFLRRFAYIARMALSPEEIFEAEITPEFAAAIVEEMLQAHKYELLDTFLANRFFEESEEFQTSNVKAAMAIVFAKYEKYDLARQFWIQAAKAPGNSDERGVCLSAAARMAYYEEDYDAALLLLDVASAYVKEENHLLEEIEKWIREKAAEQKGVAE